jgi:SAM-dependent methyltransferase
MTNDRAARERIWTVGDYPTVARLLLPISVEAVEAIDVRPGQRVLDVATGNGNAAIEAARRGAHVTGVDLTPAQIERATARCAREGVEVELLVGDAEDLPVPGAAFDAVLSVMGVIFAPDHARAMAELARVCRPGGTVALTTWTTHGWLGSWRPRLAELLELPPVNPDVEEWGDADVVRARFGAAGLDAVVERREFAFTFASPDEALDTFLLNGGPFIDLMERAESMGRAAEARRALREVVVESDVGGGARCVLPSPYLLVLSRKAP